MLEEALLKFQRGKVFCLRSMQKSSSYTIGKENCVERGVPWGIFRKRFSNFQSLAKR